MNNEPTTSSDRELKFKEYQKRREIFDQKDETGFTTTHTIGIDYTTTEVGIFLPTETTIIYTLFEDLIANGFLDPRLPFLDAGSGDARVNHIAALHGVQTSIGIEYSSDIFEKSKKQTKEFEDAKILKSGCVRLIQGDFTDIETYTKHGIASNNIKTFFNYVNGWKELLAFIHTHSPIGTTLILIDEQWSISKRIIEEIAKYKSIVLKESIRYIHHKGKDRAEILTPELLKKIKQSDDRIEQQHIHVDISPSEQFSITDTEYRVVTVYLLEKIS